MVQQGVRGFMDRRVCRALAFLVFEIRLRVGECWGREGFSVWGVRHRGCS